MYVCLCKGITDTQIQAAIENGSQSMRQLHRELGVASQCGKCTIETRKILKASKSAQLDYSLAIPI